MITRKLVFIVIPATFLMISFLHSCSSSTSVSNKKTAINFSADTSVTDIEGYLYVIENTDEDKNRTTIPTISRFRPDGNLEWKVEYDNSSVKVTGVLITLDELNRPWAVFHVNGDSGSSNYIRVKHVSENAFKNVYQPLYGTGGETNISLIARINSSNGIIEKATFLSSQLSNGNSNTLEVLAVGVNRRTVHVQAESAFTPPYPGSSYVPHPHATHLRDCNFFPIQIGLDIDLNFIKTSKVFTMKQLLDEPYSAWYPSCERRY